MNKRLIITMGLAVGLPMLPAANAPTIYKIVNNPAVQSGYTLSGTITTDGTLGTIYASNVLAWSFLASNGVSTYSANSSEPGSSVSVIGIVATADYLKLPASTVSNPFAINLSGPTGHVQWAGSTLQNGAFGSAFQWNGSWPWWSDFITTSPHDVPGGWAIAELQGPPAITNILVLPANPVISTAQTQPFIAVGVMDDGSLTNLPSAASANWTRLQPTGTLPPRRADSFNIYDPTHNVLVVHGGNPNGCTFDPLYSDIWKLSNANGLGGTPTWTQLLPAGTAPAARQGHKGGYNAVTDRMVFFGGDLTCGCSKLSDLWVLTNATARAGSPGWIQLTAVGGPPTKRSHGAAVYDAANNRMTIFGGYDCSAGNLNDVWVLSNADGSTGTPQWTQLTPSGTAPTGRLIFPGVYDPASNRMIIFGGTTCCPSTRLYFNDVWVLTCANGLGGTPQWIQLNPAGTLPGGRCGQVAEYDPATKRMIVFGGGGNYTPSYGNDVWVLSNADGTSGTPKWSQLIAGGDIPVGRGRENSQPASAYDPASNRLIIFGGGTGLTPHTTNDTYVLSTANGGVFWSSGNTNVATINSSGLATPAIQGLAPITATYGTLSGNTTLWITNIPPSFTTGLVNQSVSLGSTATFAAVISGSQPMTYVWTLNGTAIAGAIGATLTITNVGPGNAGYYAVAAMNPWGTNISTARLSVMVGLQVLPANPVISTAQTQPFIAVGVMDDGSLTNLPSAAAASWTRLQPSGTLPPRRANSLSIYDPTHNVLVVHDGNPNLCTFDPLYSDVWKLSNANGLGGTPTWTQLLPAGTAPAARQGHKGGYNTVTDRMVFFGGDLTCGCSKLSDLWVLTNATARAGSPGWKQLTATGGPPTQRSDGAAVYDAANNRMTIFGGFDCSAGNLNDVWVLSNADGSTGTPQWTQLTPTGTAPTGRQIFPGVYDPASNRMIIFGGTTCCPSTRPYFNDVWVLTCANGLGGTPQWIQLNPSGTLPGGRCGQVAEYDPATKRMIVFGGGGSYTPYYGNDVWVLSNADGTSGTPQWSQLVPGGDIPVGRGRENGQPASAYDPASNRLVIFGGGTGLTPSTTNDTYVLDGANGVGGVWWSSSHTNVATINSVGLATPASQGLATITATYGALSGNTTLLVTNIPPSFTTGLVNQSVGFGNTATFTAVVSGSQPMTYVWSLNGTVIPGATGSTLTVTNVGPATVGLYTVTVTNPGGTKTSSAALSLVDLKMYAGLNIYGPVPANYRIDVQNTLGGTNVWTALDTITATNSPYFYLDTNSPAHYSRFYRAVWQP